MTFFLFNVPVLIRTCSSNRYLLEGYRRTNCPNHLARRTLEEIKITNKSLEPELAVARREQRHQTPSNPWPEESHRLKALKRAAEDTRRWRRDHRELVDWGRAPDPPDRRSSPAIDDNSRQGKPGSVHSSIFHKTHSSLRILKPKDRRPHRLTEAVQLQPSTPVRCWLHFSPNTTIEI